MSQIQQVCFGAEERLQTGWEGVEEGGQARRCLKVLSLSLSLFLFFPFFFFSVLSKLQGGWELYLFAPPLPSPINNSVVRARRAQSRLYRAEDGTCNSLTPKLPERKVCGEEDRRLSQFFFKKKKAKKKKKELGGLWKVGSWTPRLAME